MPDIGFVNGEFMPLSEAKVSVEDRGYQFGDGVYEVIRTYGRNPFQLEAHLDRLERSARSIALSIPYTSREWAELVAEGIRTAGYAECRVYIQLTRGVAPRDHSFPPSGLPSVVLTVREMFQLDAQARTAGVDAITVEDLRWGRCDIKSVNLLPNVIARQQAKEAGAFESILVSNGLVTEGAVTNVMAVQSGIVRTSPVGRRVLDGVTRGVVLNLVRKEGIPVDERSVGVDELRASEEVFLTGTTVEILPVVRIDGLPIGQGRPGALTQLLCSRFHHLVGRESSSTLGRSPIPLSPLP